MTTWFMQVIHFPVQLCDIAVIHFQAPCCKMLGEGGRRELDYNNATAAPKMKHYVMTAVESQRLAWKRQKGLSSRWTEAR